MLRNYHQGLLSNPLLVLEQAELPTALDFTATLTKVLLWSDVVWIFQAQGSPNLAISWSEKESFSSLVEYSRISHCHSNPSYYHKCFQILYLEDGILHREAVIFWIFFLFTLEKTYSFQLNSIDCLHQIEKGVCSKNTWVHPSVSPVHGGWLLVASKTSNYSVAFLVLKMPRF